MSENNNKIGIISQYLSTILVTAGICVEVQLGADIGFVLISIGSLVFAIATKIRHL